MECWGASGGAANVGSDVPGKGGYVSGEISITDDTPFYVYVGGVGVSYASSTSTGGGGWNGGGYASPTTSTGLYSVGGGGASDFRTKKGLSTSQLSLWNATWDNVYGLRGRILVAAGGGGLEHYSSYTTRGGGGGGLNGEQGYNTTSGHNYANYTQHPVPGATQTGSSAGYVGGSGSFGYANRGDNSSWGGGGGSGYWGGVRGYGQGGSGGSAFISGHAGCIAIASAASTTASTAGTTNSVERSKHYSGLYFINTVMIDGAGYQWTTSKGSQKRMPNPSSSTDYGTGVGHTGNGFARITYVP